MENTIHHYSMNWSNKSFDERNLQKPISELSLEDINWCLRNRYYLNQILDITINKIEANWDIIDQYYPSQICQWYDEAIKEIITIPFNFWESRIESFMKIREYVKASTNRPIELEKSFIELFLKHDPKPKNWTIDDSTEFLDNLGYAQGLDLAGNFIEAFNQIKMLKYALMYGQTVYIEPAYKSISNENELYDFIVEEYSEIGEDLIRDQIIEPLKKERKINVANMR